MKYCVLIMDGAAGLPIPEKGGKTSLQLAKTPNLDFMTKGGTLGLVRTVPPGMEPSSACACMSVIGYDPKVYYKGRAGIEALSMGIPVEEGEVVFRCNLVAVKDGAMYDYSSGHISNGEARQLIDALNKNLGDENIHFYPGVGYRHICKFKDKEDTLQAVCTPPHDIPGKPISQFLPRGKGSEFLNDLMKRSESILKDHPVNVARRARGETPATMIWLFWSGGRIPDVPSFKKLYKKKAAITSGVDLLRGLGQMVGMDILEIEGVTDLLDNDYTAQTSGALEALEKHDLVIIHIEAPDEAGHSGSAGEKIEAIERIDKEVLSRLCAWRQESFRVLVMPDHPTPVTVRTHIDQPVPFLMWGDGFKANGAHRFTEPEAGKTGLFIDPGYNIMDRLINNSLI